MMRTDAGLHADQARGHIGKACFDLTTRPLLPQARLRHDHRAQRRGTSSYRYQCRLRQSHSVLSQPWRAPCLGAPGQLIAGGAGARPDHPISGRRLASRAITTNALLDRDFSPPEVRTKGRPTAARGRLHAQAVAAAQCPGRGPTALASLLCRLVAERSPSKTTFSLLSCDTGSTGGESAFGAASAHNKLPTGSSL